MNDHLPECLFVERDGWVQRPCICEELRACEQRVLDAVREAIVALPHFGDFVDTVDVFAAIDTLGDDQR